MKKYYITTPIYYVNSVPHVGHALTMLVSDVTKRYQQMQGREVVFLTGTDENGLKILEAAKAAGETPQAFVDRISQTFRVCADELNISYDVFFRTTCQRHKDAVQALFTKLQENGYVYIDKYEGWYDVSAETFFKESDLVDGKSPEGNEVQWVSEENYFFKLSAFAEPLLKHIEENPDFLLPEVRKNEVVSFIKQGLRDMCVSRNNPGWGIPFPGDESKVVYVWFDALINYLAYTGWPDAGWDEVWPADVHWMAKEIFTRFHATLWPAMLMGAGLPLPKHVVGHGWFTFNDAKMSKSKGNVLAPADLKKFFTEAGCSNEMAVDAIRFSLARCLPFESDTNFTISEIERVFNSDLANDLGNALNRTLSMAQKFSEGVVDAAQPDADVLEVIRKAKEQVEAAFVSFRLNEAVDAALSVVRFLNKYINDEKPWELAKNNDPRLGEVMNSMLFGLRATEGLIRPFIPAAADNILAQLGYQPSDATTLWSQIGDTTRFNFGGKVNAPVPMFPRLEIKPVTQEPAAPAPAPEPKPAPAKKPAFEVPAEIDITDFMKVKLQVGRVLEAEAIADSDKLLKLQVVIGEEKRQIVAGIRKSYTPEDLIGRQVIVVMNLKPAKLRGHESQGMLLAADGPDGQAILLQPEAEAPEGSSVH